MGDILRKYEKYLIEDKPIPYKNILIYPVLTKDYLNFQMVANCIIINKNEMSDPKAISMSYLDFIVYYASKSNEHQVFLLFFIELLKLCLHIEDKDIDLKYNEKKKVELYIKNEKYDRHDFDIIRRIICEQNCVELDEDDKTPPALKKILKENLEFINKNKKKMCSFEDQIICVMLALHETNKQIILNMPIRTFTKVIARYDTELHYKIYKTASLSGMVEFKEDIDHWMSDLTRSPEDRYKEVEVDYNNFQKKMEKVT